MAKPILSGGRASRYLHEVYTLPKLAASPGQVFNSEKMTVFHGMGRSYGDVALNADGALCQTREVDSLISFDRRSGLLRAHSGLTIGALNQMTVPNGWIVPVSPGTQYVTLGGAVANDVHGKNHHRVGSFGAHVKALSLRRSNGEVLTCDRKTHSDMFEATISGLGLTGYIEWVEIQLTSIRSANVYVETIPYPDLKGYFDLSEQSQDWMYTVAWVDCFAGKSKLGSGVFSRARFGLDGDLTLAPSAPVWSLPFPLPSRLLNKISISAFNKLYKRRPGARFSGVQKFQRFLYPLDGIGGWNKLYGRTGFYQHQSIIPKSHAAEGVSALLAAVQDRGWGSFLAVLKTHGRETSPGLNTFSMAGVSLALDFPNRGEQTTRFLRHLDQIVVGYGGRMYPAKDSVMSSETFQAGYPNWQKLEALRDPKVSSSFWRRVSREPGAIHAG